jgi:hypothetical protein
LDVWVGRGARWTRTAAAGSAGRSTGSAARAKLRASDCAQI